MNCQSFAVKISKKNQTERLGGFTASMDFFMRIASKLLYYRDKL